MSEQTETSWQRKNRERSEKKQAAIAKLPPLPHGDELWYIGRDDECYSIGTEKTRDAAIHVGENDCDGEGFYIVCARIDPVDIAAHFDMDMFVEDIDEGGDYLSGDGADSVFENCTADQMDDLENRVRATMRSWQIECHSAGNVITGDLFTISHSAEYISGKDDGK